MLSNIFNIIRVQQNIWAFVAYNHHLFRLFYQIIRDYKKRSILVTEKATK